jgi:hypothetical protein
MAQASAISVSKLTVAVEAAVKAAVQQHPKFKIDKPQIAASYFIWGIPVPELLLATLSVRETQAFATAVASHLGGALPGPKSEGAVFSVGGYLIVGIPPEPNILLER